MTSRRKKTQSTLTRVYIFKGYKQITCDIIVFLHQ